ncbi:putative tributyrin esterase [Enterococcus sp. PF1-24]|uniref:alpha/beta hydrolase n=1 Tax=unclassified Enterococcus TaxID=2608891 RepID=UPI0024740E58|nr:MULTISPECIES: alpha/beta hydrolase family protein [unclassified Enterococcus]MDH6364856.1 putative tributyrin esterase [Enterococcus sp. PFB1-1]MDH6401920.1 putative tributyrin esterase [Enterococcus sp. PF1-24]
MAFIQASVYSNVLEREVDLQIILPQQTEKIVGTSSAGASDEIPVLYLLHGMGGNHSCWERRTSIERYVADYGIAVIMPSTDLGWYTDTTYDMKYWTYVSEELPKICHELFPQISQKRENTYAAGLSMGGYGALKLALRKPENYAAIVSLSGAVLMGLEMERLFEIRGKAYWEGIFGPLDQVATSENAPLHLLEELVASGKEIPRIYLACGTEDFLYGANQGMHQAMEKLKVAHTFEEGPGDHNWQFWDEWIQRGLAWMFAEK